MGALFDRSIGVVPRDRLVRHIEGEYLPDSGSITLDPRDDPYRIVPCRERGPSNDGVLVSVQQFVAPTSSCPKPYQCVHRSGWCDNGSIGRISPERGAVQ
jgi:hypothetical protein